jgi:predicted transcriptional regulator
MNEENAEGAPQILALTAQIVAAHVAGNTVSPEALPALIQSVHSALTGAGKMPEPVEQLQPAVPVKRSIQHEYLVCLEDGAKMKMLKRYLATRFNMTPEQYRAKWGLPADYPMTAPAYAERRSVLAKESGLGRKVAEPDAAKPAKPAKAASGRKRRGSTAE